MLWIHVNENYFPCHEIILELYVPCLSQLRTVPFQYVRGKEWTKFQARHHPLVILKPRTNVTLSWRNNWKPPSESEYSAPLPFIFKWNSPQYTGWSLCSSCGKLATYMYVKLSSQEISSGSPSTSRNMHIEINNVWFMNTFMITYIFFTNQW